MNFHLYKMQGCGNDFIFIDGIHDSDIRVRPRDVTYLCDRHFGVGADGLIVLAKSEVADARWTFFNSDGSEAEMCGNAARCAILFLGDRYLPGDEVISLETKVGIIKGRKLRDGLIEVSLTSQKDFKVEYSETILEVEAGVLQVYTTQVGVPHAVMEVKDIFSYPISRVGRQVQQHPMFQAAGINVTFFQRSVGKRIFATTFERGVEAETLACGTGAAAAAIVFSELYLESLPITVEVPGGELTVDLSPVSSVLLLQGPAEFLFELDVVDPPADFEKVYPYETAKRRKA